MPETKDLAGTYVARCTIVLADHRRVLAGNTLHLSHADAVRGLDQGTISPCEEAAPAEEPPTPAASESDPGAPGLALSASPSVTDAPPAASGKRAGR